MNSITRSYRIWHWLQLHSMAAIVAVVFVPTASSAQNGAAGSPAASQSSSADISGRYPAGSIRSVETAEQVLQEIDRERTRIEAQYADEEHACYPKFFASSCIDAAKEKRRHALSQIRPVEVEANAFKRRARVAERDKALADKRAGDEAEALKRATEQKDKEVAKAGKETGNAQQAEKSAGQDRNGQKTKTADRVAQHQARLKQAQAEEAANAQKRAANVAAYEKKVQESQARQREIAAKKAEQERERAAKDASPPKP